MTPPAARPGPPDSWDADAPQGPGQRVRALFRRVFGEGENILDWALPLFSLAGIRVRVHIFFLVFIAARLLWSIPRDELGPLHMALSMGLLFVLVLLHEFGHCLACRAVDGEADDIVMWPLGGLAMCDPPPTWRAHLITALGGPAVNVAIIPLTSLAFVFAGLPERIVFNPFRIGLYLGSPEFGSWALTALALTHALNIVLLGFNLLLPMLPLDGGRALEALLWRRMGRRAAAELALRVGFVMAAVVGVAALAGDQVMILGVALFAGLYCWIEWQQLRSVETLGDPSFGAGAWMALRDDESPPAQTPRERRLSRRLERERREQAEVDRILAKIASSGMKSLSRKEKAVLKRATKRKNTP